jgi:hypothetical protein
VVFSGLFPTDTEQYPDLRDALLKLQVRHKLLSVFRAQLSPAGTTPTQRPPSVIITHAPEVTLSNP